LWGPARASADGSQVGDSVVPGGPEPPAVLRGQISGRKYIGQWYTNAGAGDASGRFSYSAVVDPTGAVLFEGCFFLGGEKIDDRFLLQGGTTDPFVGHGKNGFGRFLTQPTQEAGAVPAVGITDAELGKEDTVLRVELERAFCEVEIFW